MADSTALKFLTDHAFKIVALVTTLLVTVTGGIATAFILGAAAWAWSMNDDNVQIKVNMSSMAEDLKEVRVALDELNSIEKRVTHIETTRFSDKDAEHISRQLNSQEQRIRELEFILKKVE